MERSRFEIFVRPGRTDDVEFLARMLYEAYYWNPDHERPTYDEFRTSSEAISRFVDGWGRPGDRAVVAEVEGTQVGAAWYRQLHADNAGNSFVDESIPCLAIAVAADHRGYGIGGRLLDALLDHARRDGFTAVTLAVEVDNPAGRLYRRHGFREDAEIDGYCRMRAALGG